MHDGVSRTCIITSCAVIHALCPMWIMMSIDSFQQQHVKALHAYSACVLCDACSPVHCSTVPFAVVPLWPLA